MGFTPGRPGSNLLIFKFIQIKMAQEEVNPVNAAYSKLLGGIVHNG